MRQVAALLYTNRVWVPSSDDKIGSSSPLPRDAVQARPILSHGVCQCPSVSHINKFCQNE